MACDRLMIEVGTHKRVIQKRRGHSSIRTTMDVYRSVREDVDARGRRRS